MFTKTCKDCGKVVEYETEEELKLHFYKKSHGYFQNSCKDCTKKYHSEKYAEGAYNYNRKKNDGYVKEYVIGNLNRCF